MSGSEEAGAATRSPARSRRSLVIAGAAAALVVLAVVGAGVALASRATKASEDVHRAIDMLGKADRTIEGIDSVIRAEVTSGVVGESEKRRGELPGVVDELEGARTLLQGAQPRLGESEKGLAAAAADSLDARLDMLAVADRLLEVNGRTAAALGYCRDGWQLYQEAETISEGAVADYNRHTKESVTRARDADTRAQGKLREGRALFDQAAIALPEAKLSAYLAYADSKLAAVAVSLEMDGLWLDGELEKANAKVAAYNQLDKKASAAAAALKTPSGPVAEAYASLTKADEAAYFEARDRASRSDAALRKLIGE